MKTKILLEKNIRIGKETGTLEVFENEGQRSVIVTMVHNGQIDIVSKKVGPEADINSIISDSKIQII